MPLFPLEKRAPAISHKPAKYLREIITMPKLDNESIQLILFALIALAMLAQAAILLAAVVVMRKAFRATDEKLEELRSSVIPLIDKSRALVTSLAPKIEGTVDDVAALAHSLRVQTADLQTAADEIVGRLRTQAGRLDGMLSNLFDTVEHAGAAVSDAVNKPMRQLSGILASVRAFVETMRSGAPAPSSQAAPPARDHDMFV
jgi:ABC-type transporter Mla subunit MlaD